MAHSGCNLRNALREARELGCFIEDVRGTGEVRVLSPDRVKRCKINIRRKDAPRALTVVVNYARTLRGMPPR